MSITRRDLLAGAVFGLAIPAALTSLHKASSIENSLEDDCKIILRYVSGESHATLNIRVWERCRMADLKIDDTVVMDDCDTMLQVATEPYKTKYGTLGVNCLELPEIAERVGLETAEEINETGIRCLPYAKDFPGCMKFEADPKLGVLLHAGPPGHKFLNGKTDS